MHYKGGTTYDIEAYRLLGLVKYAQLDYAAAAENLQISREILLNDDRIKSVASFAAELEMLLGKLLLLLGRAAEAAQMYRIAAERHTDSAAEAYSSYLLSKHYGGWGKDNSLTAHRRINEFFDMAVCEQHKHRQHEKIRVGYVSADFRQHVMFNFYYVLLRSYDRSKFAVYCYSLGIEDGYTKQLRSCVDVWQDVRKMTAAQAAELISSDEIDILVDLSGHSAGNGLAIFAYYRHPHVQRITGRSLSLIHI